MNSKYLSVCTGVLAAGALAVSTTPAQAASFLGIPITPSNTLVRGQTTTGTAGFPYTAGTFTPTETITVQFSVNGAGLGTRGKNLSSFGFISGSTYTPLIGETLAFNPGGNASNDFLGTAGVAITGPTTVNYTFQKGVTYQLALNSTGTHSSWAVAQLDSYKFSTAADNRPLAPLTVTFPGFYILGFEDGNSIVNGKTAFDYQDVVLTAKLVPTDVPEPATMAGLGLLGGLMAFARRRKAAQPA